MNLRSRVRLILILTAILPVLAVGALATYRANNDVESEVIRGRLAQVRALASSLDETLQGARRSLQLAAAWWADERAIDQVESPESSRVMHRLWRRLHREVPIYSNLSILDVHGKTIFGEPLAMDPDLGAHSFGGFVGDVVYDQGRPYVPVVAQARSRTGERVGVLVARIDLGFTSSLARSVPLGDNARLLVLDGLGQTIARSDAVPLTQRDTQLDAVVRTALGRATEGEIRDHGHLSIYRSLLSFQSRRAVPWALVLDQPEADAFALARQAAWDTAMVAFFAFLLVLVLSSMLATSLTRPLWRLAKRADAIADGEVHSDIPPVQAPGEMGILAKRLEEMAAKIAEREQLQTALAHEDRLATIGMMAASVAHEINNPLTTILGYSKLLLEDKTDENPDSSGLKLISDEATRMKTIIGTMLDYARSGDGSQGSSDLLQVLARVQTLLGPALKKQKLMLTLEVQEGLEVTANEQSLQQIFINLLQNAAQASEVGSTILIRAKQRADDVVVFIDDEGSGIPDADRDRIFDAFFTTKNASQGTGLGLAVVKHLVGEFRGSITALAGKEDHGTSMRLVIPSHRESEHEHDTSH